MRLKFPCFLQKLEYDCGPTALKMVLAAFGVRADRRKLMRQLRTTERDGSTRRSLIRVARRYGLRVSAHNDATLGEVGRLLRRGALLIVEYILPVFEGGHYAVVSGLDSRSIYLHDPSEGRYYRLPRREFVRRWYGRHTQTHTRWVLVADGPRGAGRTTGK
jgi:ABC-type bacteriocin/lantibiotic exporter with double-glycine peptidase domain